MTISKRMPAPAREISRKAAIVGIGETDYRYDYDAHRARAPGYEAPTVESLSIVAFERALTDCGLERGDIDGLSVSYTMGGAEPPELAKILGLNPRYCVANGNIMAGPLPVVSVAIANGEADTVAMVFAVAYRSRGSKFGGNVTNTEGVPSSYYSFHPWGWSSQAAHSALGFTYYQAKYGAREEDLGSVAIQVREHAIGQANAVMQSPITMEAYMASRYIVRPLHLFDICLVNDGAVCLIVRRSDLAKNMPHPPVLVAGWGASRVKNSKMHVMVREQLRPLMQEAGGQALGMAGVPLSRVRHFEGYDASTIHLINQVEGYGFAEPGAGIEFCKHGQLTIGGRLPTNMAGGNLSGSYMQGWSQIPEVVRQLRHEAVHQIPSIETSMSSLLQTEQAHPIIFTRES